MDTAITLPSMSRKTAPRKGDRVTIVGAGPGGLAAAILLAAAGLKVTVLERLDRVGGRTSILEADGFRFDIGPTFFLYPQVLEEIFAAAGYDLRREVEMVRLDPQYRLIFGGGGELLSTSRIDEHGPPGRRAVAERRREPSGVFWTTTVTSSSASAPASSRRSSAGRTSRLPASCACCPSIRPWRSLDAELADLLQRPAHPARLLVPVEVPGDVALPLPEPVLDPLLPRVRVRRLPSDRRLRRGDRGDGAGGARAGGRDPDRRAGARRSSSRGGGRSASAPTPASTARTRC